jgi:predicted amidohydrolase YtcJ
MSFQGESFISRYGRGAAGATPPFRKMIQMGIPVAMGTDATRVSSYNPWVALHWLVTGKTLGGTALYPKENLLDRTQALGLYTQGSAALTGEDNTKEPSKPANSPTWPSSRPTTSPCRKTRFRKSNRC